jgi:hypothetical protein
VSASKITIGFGFDQDANGKPLVGEPLTQNDVAFAVKTYARTAGVPGYSLGFNHEGGWVNAQGQLIVERGAIVTGYVRNALELGRWRSLARYLCEFFGQECVVFAVEPVQSFEYLGVREAA